MIQLVFAHNGYNFGAEDGMPWPHISQDFKNFKERTEGTTLVMGAKTFASLPSILKGRKHIVLCDVTRPSPLAKSGEYAHQYLPDWEYYQLFKKWAESDKVYSIIGGTGILEKALPFAQKVIKTSIVLNPLMPKIDATQWLTQSFLLEIEGMRIDDYRVYTDVDWCINEVVFVK